MRPIRKEQRQKRRDWKCRVVGPKGNLIRCPNKCEECPYAKAGKPPKGNNLSLDELKECGVEIIYEAINLEEQVIQEEKIAEETVRVHNAIKRLEVRDQQIVRMFYFENLNKEQIAQKLGVSHQAISKRMKKIHEILKSFL